jgi:hypothetical protein
MTDRELPISDERLEELSAGLSDEARVVLDRLVANQELDPELRQHPDTFADDLDALVDDDKEKLDVVFTEILKGYARRVRRDEAEMELFERGMKDVERAGELDPSLSDNPTLGEAAAVLQAHGETPLLSEEEMNVVVEIAPPEEAIDAMGWIKMPESEVETDENGIPTRKAAEYGFGLREPETGEIIRLYPLHAEAMRAIASRISFREFIEGYLDEIPNLKREYLKLFDEGSHYMEMVGIDREEFARDMTSNNLRDAYLLTLARMAKEYPRGPRGIIDFYRDRETRAARRYKKWTQERTREVVTEVAEQMIEAGIFVKFTGEDGVEYLRRGPNYEEWRREREEEDE